MAAEEKKSESTKRVAETQRFRYIGFDVFPGKPKDLFKSDAEKKKYEEQIQAKRSKGEIVREHCTLLEERISGLDRFVLTLASIVIVLSMFLPWYSVYNEKVVESKAKVAGTQTEKPVVADSADLILGPGDTVNMASDTTTLQAAAPVETPDTAAAAAGAAGTPAQSKEGTVVNQSAGEEVLSSYVARKKVERTYAKKSAVGAIFSLGSLGSYVFSSGAALAITAILFIIYTLLCIVLPIVTLYGVYGVKGTPDARALHVKKLLRFNWIPLIIFFVMIVLSFFGSSYGFDAANTFTSIGSSYGTGVLLGSISWGVVVSMGAFILIGAKGVEI